MATTAAGGAAGAGVWGTREELVLGDAVLRHGHFAWFIVAHELCSRSPCTFSPEDCEAKFAEIQLRYSACNDWYAELRKQRIAELKKEIEKSDNTIQSLQSVIEKLKNSKEGDKSSDCHTTHAESSSHFGNKADTNLSSKDLSRDKSSPACFTEETANCQKSQQVLQCDTDSIQTDNTSTEESFLKPVDAKVYDKESSLWGSRKQRGRRVRKNFQNADSSSINGEHISTTCIEGNICSEVCKDDMKKGLNLEAPNVEPDIAKKGLKTSNAESNAMKDGLKTPNVEPVVLKKGVTTPGVESAGVMDNLKTLKVDSGFPVLKRGKAKLTAIVKFISTEGDGLMLQRRVDVLRKRAAYKKIIRQHMNIRMMKSKIRRGVITSPMELLRDILLFVNNITIFYPKATLEHKAAIKLRELAYETLNESSDFFSKKSRRRAHGDAAEGSKVPSSRDAAANAMQGEGKDTTHTGKPRKIILKIVRKREHGNNKKIGVDEPTNSEPLKRSAPAPEDGPSEGSKRIQQGP